MKRAAYSTVGAATIAWLLACGGAGNTSNDDADTPSTTENRASGARDAGLEQAKHVLVQLGLVPTSANWPWETIRAAEYNDGKDLPPRYAVTGTVESNGNVSQWSALVMFEGENVKGCMVSFQGDVVWTLPSYAQQLSDAKEIGEASAGETISATPIKGFDDYDIGVQESGELTICQVTFHSLPPTSDIAAEVVRNAVTQLVEKNADREILAMAFNTSGDALPDTHYGGALVYKPTDGQIRRMDERQGLQTVEADRRSYYVQIEDGRTAKGISPERSWYNVSIVFPDEPSAREIKAVALKEIGKLKSRVLDVNVYIYTGDKSNKITWQQLEAPNGKYMAIDYVAATDEVSPNWDWSPSPALVDRPSYESRIWNDATGQFSVHAVFVSYANGQVTIKRDDNGEVITIPLDKLSDDSKQYIRSLKK